MRKKLQKGLTYLELVTVLAIVSLMTALSINNFRTFQYNVEIKNLANGIGLKFSEAQKSAIFGKLNPPLQTPLSPDSWKPSYGVSFDMSPSKSTGPTTFYYFVDLNQDKVFSHDPGYTCPLDDCIDRIDITKGNKVESLKIYGSSGNYLNDVNQVDVTYMRPSATATFYSGGQILSNVGYLEVNLLAQTGQTAVVRVYGSGRIQII